MTLLRLSILAAVLLGAAGAGLAQPAGNGPTSAPAPASPMSLEERMAPSPLRFTSFDVPRAYPGLAYYTRMAVLGGKWPYTFKLLAAPNGAKLTPDRGEVHWVPPTEGEKATFTMQVSGSQELLAAKLVFVDPQTNDYRLKMTPELEKLAGPGDYLGAHPRVLEWAAAGSPLRNRDNFLQRLATMPKGNKE